MHSACTGQTQKIRRNHFDLVSPDFLFYNMILLESLVGLSCRFGTQCNLYGTLYILAILQGLNR